MDLHPKFISPGQQPNEKIYLITRRHWVVLAKEIAVWLLFVALLLAYDLYLTPTFPTLKTVPFAQIGSALKTVYLMFLIAGLFTIWILYYLNYQVVTNERVVDVDQKNLLHHAFSEVSLSRIQDVTVEVKGFLATFFDYGHVLIQTAGEQTRFEFDDIPNPHKVAKLILDLSERLPADQKNSQL